MRSLKKYFGISFIKLNPAGDLLKIAKVMLLAYYRVKLRVTALSCVSRVEIR